MSCSSLLTTRRQATAKTPTQDATRGKWNGQSQHSATSHSSRVAPARLGTLRSWATRNRYDHRSDRVPRCGKVECILSSSACRAAGGTPWRVKALPCPIAGLARRSPTCANWSRGSEPFASRNRLLPGRVQVGTFPPAGAGDPRRLPSGSISPAEGPARAVRRKSARSNRS